ncbi:DUF1850 domain-containing protein [Dongia sp.]|uniref:DUF1850 domain-containing protein n=1 Tax=Dongia sp. TaxID=1977262 RepID=UPI0035B1801D
MNVCLLLGAKKLLLAGSTFTLAWSHSVEKTRWEEDWQVGLAGFQLVEARIAGSGAGMEPPEGAILDGKVWRYRPALAFVEDRLVLARSGATGGAWQVCGNGACHPIPETGAEGPAILEPCP